MPKRTPTTADATIAVGYLRRSTSDQPNSPAAQADAIRRYAAHHGLRVAAWFEDVGVSGAKPAMDRPGFAAAVEALSQHGAAVLLVAKRDRLGRDVVEVGLAERLVRRLGARVQSADGTGNGDDAESALLRGVVDVFAAYERAVIKLRTKAALRARKDRSLKFTRFPPFGFAWTKDGRMVENPTQQQTLRRMRALRRRGLSYRRVGVLLMREGRKPQRAAAWCPSMLRSLCLRQPEVAAPARSIA